MMKKFLSLFLAAFILLCGLSAVSFAQTRHNINRRQARQQRRIANGIKSGRLTSREASRLERRESRLNRVERRDRRSGGKLTNRERRNLEHRLNRNSRRIYRQKHDRQHQ